MAGVVSSLRLWVRDGGDRPWPGGLPSKFVRITCPTLGDLPSAKSCTHCSLTHPLCARQPSGKNGLARLFSIVFWSRIETHSAATVPRPIELRPSPGLTVGSRPLPTLQAQVEMAGKLFKDLPCPAHGPCAEFSPAGAYLQRHAEATARHMAKPTTESIGAHTSNSPTPLCTA
ncbi:hypothetical protein K461DRAFT_135680 [Myriangium duriaei CBS 260.36]|uniref:Uncharacterized protein n=1 Tax=Myriangium duriaei CBS 260.36 TaxID=1168546 RepID=A0A9P4J666_9PEZI|nr:hypothetical protein K461DRAFT_135680 [Myriangium duriaei CBS 260.36]